jgi:hypothetical protein
MKQISRKVDEQKRYVAIEGTEVTERGQYTWVDGVLGVLCGDEDVLILTHQRTSALNVLRLPLSFFQSTELRKSLMR